MFVNIELKNNDNICIEFDNIVRAGSYLEFWYLKRCVFMARCSLIFAYDMKVDDDNYTNVYKLVPVTL